MRKNGKYKTPFFHIYSDHRVALQAWRCSNKNCSWSATPSIQKHLSGKIHTDLVKLQAEFGARHSYRQAAKDLSALTSSAKKINNKSRIHRTTNQVGKILDNKGLNPVNKREKGPAKELYAAIDGGHVHDARNKGHNFEVMVGKIYRPENVIRIDKSHMSITEKHCAASAKYDNQETMKTNLIEAAKQEGIDRNITEMTILADGAKNCWNIAESLRNFCYTVLFILDWFHIGKYAKNLKDQLPAESAQIIDEVKQELWLGRHEEARKILTQLQSELKSQNYIKKVENFSTYIQENKNNIVNYQARQAAGLIYTSHVAESTVEHMLNERAKRKQKMQWSREGLHAVMQIRCSQVNNEWEEEWRNNILPIFQMSA